MSVEGRGLITEIQNVGLLRFEGGEPGVEGLGLRV